MIQITEIPNQPSAIHRNTSHARGVDPTRPHVLVLAACAIIFYRLALHPLARVPGPKLAAISNVWHALHVRDGRMFALGKTLHKKYGPVVRVGPNEVWFDSKDAFKSIYRAGSGYEKSEFYCEAFIGID
ncbi:hypothetical protein BN1723_014292 [Verticillium longisporum]|uniref:Cytochrome P450 n=1 Tax=Verticillium longisporum TaxID=100787 RepID=A0A0G4M6E8_VERLO|nr:hypothetical protein BN1723_014292 [Verticillium longisporum]